MSADDLPIMRLHRGDYLRVTLGWPPIARLIYLELLGAQWDRGILPAEWDHLRGIVSGITDIDWAAAWSFIEPHLPLDDDGRRNPALAEDRDRTVRLIESRRRGARKTNNRRYGVIDGGRDDDR